MKSRPMGERRFLCTEGGVVYEPFLNQGRSTRKVTGMNNHVGTGV